MRTLNELLDINEPALPIIKEWVSNAIRPVELLPQHTKEKAEEALLHLQVTTRSPLGAIVYETGGISIDHGWVRVLGGGTAVLPSIYQWNNDKTIDENNQSIGYCIIAYDILGGYFCINGGALGADTGSIYYFAPDTLNFEALEVSYSDLIYFFIAGNLDDFYQDFRWETWKEDTANLPLDKAFNLVPPLWSKEGKNVVSSSLRAVPAEELYQINNDFRSGLDNIENKYR